MTLQRETFLDRRQVMLGAGVAAAAMTAACSRAAEAVTTPSTDYVDTYARFNLREQPWGPSPNAIAAMQAHIARGNRYAGDEKKDFIAFIAARDGVKPEQVLPANGSKPILAAMGAVMARSGGDLVTSTLTYRVLYESAAAFGANLVQLPMTPEWSFDYEAMLAKITPTTCGVYVCNPESTTGRAADPDALRAFIIEAAKLAPVFVDEAYIDMTPDYPANSMAPLVAAGHNVIVSRTLSKLHGLAGQRIGYAIGPEPLIKATQDLLTDHVNRAGLVAGLASLNDTAYLADVNARIIRGRGRLEAMASGLGLGFVPGSSYNGVLIDLGRPVEEVAEKLKAESVLIGARGNPAMPGWTSISVGTDAEQDRLQAALTKALA